MNSMFGLTGNATSPAIRLKETRHRSEKIADERAST